MPFSYQLQLLFSYKHLFLMSITYNMKLRYVSAFWIFVRVCQYNGLCNQHILTEVSSRTNQSSASSLKVNIITILTKMYYSRLFIYNENNKGHTFSPWLTPIRLIKYSDLVLWRITQQFACLYIFLIALSIITRTSECVITLWRSCELLLYKDISRVRRMSEISLLKTMNNMISTDDHHKLVLVLMPCYNIDLMLISMFYQQI